MKTVNTEVLRSINAAAVEQGYNRAATDELMEMLDPDGIHIGSTIALHNDGPEVIVMWLCKVVGSATPIEVMIDVHAHSLSLIPDGIEGLVLAREQRGMR